MDSLMPPTIFLLKCQSKKFPSAEQYWKKRERFWKFTKETWKVNNWNGQTMQTAQWSNNDQCKSFVCNLSRHVLNNDKYQVLKTGIRLGLSVCRCLTNVFACEESFKVAYWHVWNMS